MRDRQRQYRKFPPEIGIVQLLLSIREIVEEMCKNFVFLYTRFFSILDHEPKDRLPNFLLFAIEVPTNGCRYLTSIFKTFASMLTVASLQTQIQVKEYMEVIRHVQRFPMVWMLLSKGEKDVVRKVLDRLGREGGEISEREREEQLGGWAMLLK